MGIRIHHFEWIRLRVQIQDFDDKKIPKQNNLVLSKISIFSYPYASLKDVQATGEAFSPPNRKSST